jgi:DegV family protein with EDD domain
MDDVTEQRAGAAAPKIALVVDSTCDLPAADRQKYVTAMVPLHVWLGGVSYLDRVDFDPADFYRRFRETGQGAQSSQPSVGEFANVYKTLLESYGSVVSVHISGRLSGAVQSAQMAAESVDPVRVRVVDSKHVSVGTGLVVQAVAEAILAGRTLDEVAAATEAAAGETRVYGALPSLDVAVKGGRLSARTARLAGLIELKPLIVFDEEGGVHTDGARLGYYRALRAVAERVARFAAGGPVRIAIVHADGAAAAEYTRECLDRLLGGRDIPVVEAGAVITTHVGLGTVSVGVQRIKAPLGARPPAGAGGAG